jgi:hypothetical protein
MKGAIHQPYFFPWLGLFHKLYNTDKFIFFDHVQAPIGKHWLSRNKIAHWDGEMWLTIPTHKSGSPIPINEVRICYQRDFIRQHLGTVRQIYNKCPFFDETYALIEMIYTHRYEKIADLNQDTVRTISRLLGYKGRFQSSSDIVKRNPYLEELSGNDLVVELCKAAGIDDYISGVGCKSFIRPDEFEKEGVKFTFQDFIHPTYSQVNTRNFVSHLSCIDALFNVGFSGLRDMMEKQP